MINHAGRRFLLNYALVHQDDLDTYGHGLSLIIIKE